MRELRELAYYGTDFSDIVKSKRNKKLLKMVTGSRKKSMWQAVFDASQPVKKTSSGGKEQETDSDSEEAMARVCAYYSFTPQQILNMTMHDFFYLAESVVKLMHQDMAFNSIATHSFVDMPESKNTKPIISHVPKLTDSQLEFLQGNA